MVVKGVGTLVMAHAKMVVKGVDTLVRTLVRVLVLALVGIVVHVK